MDRVSPGETLEHRPPIPEEPEGEAELAHESAAEQRGERGDREVMPDQRGFAIPVSRVGAWDDEASRLEEFGQGGHLEREPPVGGIT
jgi:hypothetical protein